MKDHRHPGYANVMSTLAVFLAVAGGGVAVAAVAKDEVGSLQVKDNSLRSRDLKNREAVQSPDVANGSLIGPDVKNGSLGSIDMANGSLRGADVANNGLTGADILESSLGQVPSAANADTVDGKHASDLQTSSEFAERTDSLALTAADQQVVSTSITTTGGRVIALASLALEGPGAGPVFVYCRLRIAGISSPEYADEMASGVEGTFAATFARNLGPGTHFVALRCSESGDVTVTDGALSVWAVGS